MFITALLQQADTVARAASDPTLTEILRQEGLRPILRAALILIIGLPLSYWLAKWARLFVGGRYNPQRGLIAGKVVFYPALVILLVTVLRELGFSLAPLLGAAGILGIAIGFASQTSVSNVISGLFLIGEQPFVVDDVIQVGDTVGRVLSVDMLSVKLRTFDNKLVRIPNESLIKSEVTNITRFPIRRLDIPVGVAYKEDVQRVREVLLDVSERNPKALMEPAPVVFFEGFGDSAVNLRLAVWATKESWLELKGSIHQEIKERFDAEGIEIPFPHRTFYTGLATDPLPIRLVGDPGAGDRGDDGAEEPEEP